MSLQFSNTSTRKGIIQQIENEIGLANDAIVNDTELFKDITTAINLAYDDFTYQALRASGTWQFDDSNYTTNDGDYPIIRANLVDGQRDYVFINDEFGNKILDIYRVFVKNSATDTIFHEIYPVDQQSDRGTEGYTDGQNLEGIPNTYDKTANGIFLDPIPSYNCTLGLQIYINREPYYFTTSDTTKMPGGPGILHKYFVLKPAMDYCRRNNLASYEKLARELLEWEGNEKQGVRGRIAEYFGGRERDVRKVLKAKPISFR